MAFQHVDGTVANPYEGAFSDEIDFNGLAGYSDIYAGELKRVEKKREEVEHIESRIYSNIPAIFTIFAAIFTLVNINATGLSDEISTLRFIVFDLLIIGGFLILAFAIGALLARDGSKKSWLPLLLGVVCVVAAVLLACFEVVGIPVSPQCL